MTVMHNGYLCRQNTVVSNGHTRGRKAVRDSYLVKNHSTNRGTVTLNHVIFPASFIGKKVRFKVEVVE